jgi:hypothetical protein
MPSLWPNGPSQSFAWSDRQSNVWPPMGRLRRGMSNSGCRTILGVLLDSNEIAAFVVERPLKPQHWRPFHAVS